MLTKRRATVEDLYNVPEHGKAEIIDGELIRMSPTGFIPGRAGMKIVSSLVRHEEGYGGGYAIPNNVGFLVDLPRRQSFSPDAAWYCGVAGKIADYFAAGTQVVWDVDLLDTSVIRVYRSRSSDEPTIYARGELAEAEPAVPGWRFAVDKLFT